VHSYLFDVYEQRARAFNALTSIELRSHAVWSPSPARACHSRTSSTGPSLQSFDWRAAKGTIQCSGKGRSLVWASLHQSKNRYINKTSDFSMLTAMQCNASLHLIAKAMPQQHVSTCINLLSAHDGQRDFTKAAGATEYTGWLLREWARHSDMYDSTGLLYGLPLSSAAPAQ